MRTKYLAGLDIGTTGSKAIIFDMQGNALASAYAEYPCTYPKPNWVEQDADQIVSSTLASAKEAIIKAGVSPDDIVSVSLSAQRCCAIFLDKDGKQIRPMISWQDNRTPAEVVEIAAKMDAAEYYKRTGFPNGTTWILSKLMWIRKNEPETWAKLDKVVQMHDYCMHALGVEDYYVDLNDAGFFGFFDSTNCTWDDHILNLFEIPKSILPTPAASGSLIGEVSRAGSAASGLAVGTKISIGAGDQCAGSLGAGVVNPGDISISMGTAGAVTAHLDRPYRDPKGNIFITNHSIAGNWLLEGFQAAAAGIYRWFRDELATLEKANAEKTGQDPFVLLNEMAASVPAGSKGLVLLPYFASAATPRYNPEARGVLLGLTMAHDRSCMARAFMEGITLDMKDMIQALLVRRSLV